jgi:GNAT superfamily N-acetyltransferase
VAFLRYNGSKRPRRLFAWRQEESSFHQRKKDDPLEIRARAYLARRCEQNAPALTALDNGAEVVFAGPGGVVLYERASGVHFVSADDNAILPICDWRFEQAEPVEALALREHNIDAVKRALGLSTAKRCRQVVFIGKLPDAAPIDGLHIAPLGVDDADFVHTHYAMGFDKPYIEQRLGAGDVFGAYHHGALAGFIGRHGEGAIGMLEVLPAYRRLGIGTALVHLMIARLQRLGETPHAHIFVENAASFAMAKGIPGAMFCDEEVAWVY